MPVRNQIAACCPSAVKQLEYVHSDHSISLGLSDTTMELAVTMPLQSRETSLCGGTDITDEHIPHNTQVQQTACVEMAN